jgi:hypothetical protein
MTASHGSRTTTPTARASRRRFVLRTWGFGGLAAAWWIATTFGALELPNSVVVLVLGLIVSLSLKPDQRSPNRGVAVLSRNAVLAVLVVAAYIPVAMGMDLLLGRLPIEPAHALLTTLAAACVVLARFAETREYRHAAVLGHRELIVAVTATVAATRAHRGGELFLALVGFAVVVPVVMAVRRIRLGVASPRQLGRGRWALQAGSLWLFLALLGTAGLSGTFFVWRIFAPDAYPVVVDAFWVGLAATAVLVAVPRTRTSLAATVLALLGSIFLAGQLVGVVRDPVDPVWIGVPVTGEWRVVNGGRSTLVNPHQALRVQRDALDVLQLVDGRPYRGDGTRLDDHFAFAQPLLAVADGRVTAAVDGAPDLPVGGRTWHDMAGNHVILDIGGGRYVLYGHLRQGSVRVRVGDDVRRGQVLGQVGDSGSSDAPHLHLQVQNRPTFDVEDRTLRTYPMILDATVPDPRRSDPVRAFAEG